MESTGALEEGSETTVKSTSCFQVTDGIPILTFDPSVENFLSIMEAISELCGGTKEESFEATEIEHFKSTIVFLREWKQFYFCEWMPFHYKSKTVNFTYQSEYAEAKKAINGVKLPHFSSAAVPKVEKLPNTASAFDNDDFVLHVGGSVWALDWCPKLYENIGCDVKCEYLAIAAHPTGSEYHKIGEQLSGRGFIQIWCFLHLGDKEELLNPGGVRCRGEGRKKVDEYSCATKRRGRPRKTAPSIPNKSNGASNIDVIDEPSGQSSVSGIAFSNECCVSSEFNMNEEPKNSDNDQSVKPKCLSPIREDYDSEASVLPSHVNDCREIVTVTEKSVQDKSFIPEGIALPRLVLSLAHNGKVAWDMKWRPSDAVDSKAKHHLGYLAVLLGNGSLEVWEVPGHSLVKLLYAGCHTVGSDPRFLKLQPVFRCSRLKFGERQSIPLTLEWSPLASRDLILAGCHDGTVALWKFCSQLSSQDTKPLLCFTADTVPIRSLAWAPDDSDAECSNLIVTGGHEGLKFWDIRSPYRPLLDVCPVQRSVLGLDWLKDPRCVVIAYEDGIMRTLSLTKIADDMPVTGEPLAGTKQQGLHSQSYSFFAIWSVQVSRSTGLVAYCSSDGCTHYFQLTAEAVDKDSSRYRKPHFLCGSLAEEGPTLNINTPLTSIPLPKQPLVSKVVANEARPINSTMPALCWHDDHATNNNSSQKKRKGNQSKQAETGEEGALQIIESRGDESRKNIARFPSKTVAMHKVRWNMNKGSGRWLCYGGAAGIVRCQVISPR